MPIPYQRRLIPRAKELRRHATKQENRLWYDFLKDYRPRFQRQKTIDTFIADFYCYEARLVIEIDGAQHFTRSGKEYDLMRSGVLEQYGLEVLRFTNREIENQFISVCAQIDQIVNERINHMTIRKALPADIPAVAAIYGEIHTAEEAGLATIGWVRGVYPTQETAQAALDRDDLFVLEDTEEIVGAAIINQSQCDGYETSSWQYPAQDSEIMVLHTLTIAPHAAGRGYGKAFVSFYEAYAREQGCKYLRMDTNVKNARARAMYEKLGYREIGVIPTTFNGIAGVNMVLLEKALA